MKVSITAAGHCVEIQSDEPDTNIHRLANIAVATFRRTRSGVPDGYGAAGACANERRGERWGFTWRMGDGDYPVVR